MVHEPKHKSLSIPVAPLLEFGNPVPQMALSQKISNDQWKRKDDKYKKSLNYALNEQGNVKAPIEEGLGTGGREKN